VTQKTLVIQKMKGKKWVLVKEFNGQPTAENLSLVEYDLPDELKPNGK